MNKRTIGDLYQKQGLPLKVKIQMTKNRIREWINEFGEDGVYVSFSGGKDSTVLLDLVREDFPNVKAVFVDTGLEYPEIREFVKTFENVDWLKPAKTFKQVINEYGYPFISKEVSETVYGARKYLTQLLQENSLEASKQASKQAYIYQYKKICGIDEFAKTFKGGADNKYRKCCGIGEYARANGYPNGNADKGQSDKGEYP